MDAETASVDSESTTWTVESEPSAGPCFPTPQFALQQAPIGARKCEQATAGATTLSCFKERCKLAAGVDPLEVAKLTLCSSLPLHKEPLSMAVPFSVQTSVAPKILDGLTKLSETDHRALFATTISTVAPTLKNTSVQKVFASAPATSVLHSWRTTMQTLPPSVRKHLHAMSNLGDASATESSMALLAVLVLTQQQLYQDLLSDIFGRIPSQFMRKIDEIVDTHTPDIFTQTDTDELVALLVDAQ